MSIETARQVIITKLHSRVLALNLGDSKVCHHLGPKGKIERKEKGERLATGEFWQIAVCKYAVNIDHS
jgi:hypothetical protein